MVSQRAREEKTHVVRLVHWIHSSSSMSQLSIESIRFFRCPKLLNSHWKSISRLRRQLHVWLFAKQRRNPSVDNGKERKCNDVDRAHRWRSKKTDNHCRMRWNEHQIANFSNSFSMAASNKSFIGETIKKRMFTGSKSISSNLDETKTNGKLRWKCNGIQFSLEKKTMHEKRRRFHSQIEPPFCRSHALSLPAFICWAHVRPLTII